MRIIDLAFYAFFTGAAVFVVWSLVGSARGLIEAFREMCDADEPTEPE